MHAHFITVKHNSRPEKSEPSDVCGVKGLGNPENCKALKGRKKRTIKLARLSIPVSIALYAAYFGVSVHQCVEQVLAAGAQSILDRKADEISLELAKGFKVGLN